MQRKLFWAILGMVITFTLYTGSALASSTPNLKYEDVKISTSQVVLSDFVVSKAKAKGVGTVKGVLLVRPYKLNSGIPKRNCKWFKGGVNTYLDSRGKMIPVREKTKVYACRDTTSPSGWRKRGGGATMKDCWNVYYPPGKPHPKLYPGKIKIVKNFNVTLKITATAKVKGVATSAAICTGPGVYAMATAKGEFLASARVRVIGSARTHAQALKKGKKVIINSKQVIDLKGTASAGATGVMMTSAVAYCSNVAGPPPTVPPVTPPGGKPTCPPNYTLNPMTGKCDKDGTVGPGSNVPGQPGGPGAGGSPGPGPGPMCRDASGNIVPGTPDTNGNCPGVSSGGTSGGSTTPVPAPPAQRCIDPTTLKERDMRSDEGKDQYGYCYRK